MEIKGESTNGIICPHCGKNINVDDVDNPIVPMRPRDDVIVIRIKENESMIPQDQPINSPNIRNTCNNGGE